MYSTLLTFAVLVTIITMLLIFIVIREFYRKIIFRLNALHYGGEEHHCNYCKKSYLMNNELDYFYCPYCGRELTLCTDFDEHEEEF